jgi:glutamate racemase
MDDRPIGVFDSGMGGLTVLHECLVTMPHEDFVYLGDGARLPYGPRPLEEIRRFALEIGAYLEALGVKMILVACNAATSAGLHELQEAAGVPVVGVIVPEAHAAVQATRNRRVGLLATQATVDAGRYEELIHPAAQDLRASHGAWQSPPDSPPHCRELPVRPSLRAQSRISARRASPEPTR